MNPRADNQPVADLEISCVTGANGWLCQVTVRDHGSVRGHGSESRHSVTLTRTDFQRLAHSGESPESLVRRSFEFLLEREPKESILPSFELPVIGRYFPEFESEIRG